LPRWINQYITETAANLSTDMAIVLSKLFMRQISQTHSEDQTGISLWTLEDIEKAQAKQRELDRELERAAAPAADDPSRMDIDDEFGDGGLSDTMLGDIDLDV
jgi:DNA excision repair protein ERCC-2